MKPQQLARLLNVSAVTLRRWAGKEFAEFLSPSAQGASGSKRSFSDTDARILAWVAMLKAQNTPNKDIVATLRSAQANNWHNLPPLPGGMADGEPIPVVPRAAVEERVKALQERYEDQLQIVLRERDELKTRLGEALRDNETLRREHAESTKAMQERLTALSVQEAELRGILKQYTIGGRQWSVAGLIIGALLVGIAITVLILVITTILSAR